MTIAIVVACENNFYIIGDTLTSGDDGSFSLNTQKVFYSQKHKIAMCIAGAGSLKPIPEPQQGLQLRDILLTDFIVKQFFDHIETTSVLKIEALNSILESFLDNNFPTYKDNFLKEVSYFFGGFKEIRTNQHLTTIYSHFAGQDTELTHTANDLDKTYFSNTNFVDWAINKVTLPTAPRGMTEKNLLIHRSDIFFNFTIPHACLAFRGQNPNMIDSYLQFIRISLDGKIENKTLKYKATPGQGTGVYCIDNPPDMPLYLSYRSFFEENVAFFDGSLKKYDIKNGNPLTPPSIPQTMPASQSDPIMGMIDVTVKPLVFSTATSSNSLQNQSAPNDLGKKTKTKQTSAS